MLFSPSYQPLPFVLAAALGGILFDKLTATPAAFYPAIIFVTIILWFFFRRRSQYIAALCLLLICFAVFALRHHDYYYRFAENDIGNFAKHELYPAAVNGIVGEMPRYYPKPPDETGAVFESSDRTNLTLFVQQLRSGSGWIPVSGKISVTINGDLRHLRVGDTVQIFGRMRQPAQPQNPGDHNYADMLRGLRIRAVLFCTNENAVTVLKTGTGTLTAALKRLLETVRRQGLANLEHRLSPQTLPLAEGMIFGVRQSVDEELTQGLLETGTMHILAISGLHIALVGAITAFFLRLLNVSRKTAAVFIIICVFLYLFVTDVRTPAIRATALITFYGIAVLANRQTNFVNLLSATALL
ncbi:MAG: ComEC family competence protein, partial [Planctomycetaceae bacterium]|nr:ComEC family competence protein [Planctomycetaceae bacterium]